IPLSHYPIENLRGRTWVTRQGIHVDRMASAWLIRRFIDAKARFKFVNGKDYRTKPGEIRFDMFQAEFTHEGDRCTFEVLMERARLQDPAIRQSPRSSTTSTCGTKSSGETTRRGSNN